MIPSNPIHSTVLWFTSSPGSLGMFQLTGSQQMWCPSIRWAGRRIQGTKRLSAWPRCQGRSWSRSCWVTPGSMEGTTPSQHGCVKGRVCSINLISFCDKGTGLVHEGEAVHVVCLDFSKAFDTVSYSILLEKLGWSWLGCVHERLVKIGPESNVFIPPTN